MELNLQEGKDAAAGDGTILHNAGQQKRSFPLPPFVDGIGDEEGARAHEQAHEQAHDIRRAPLSRDSTLL